ncbi:MAG: nucleotidyltransferase domain-containing protein [Candidatus Thermoplasmatota archaeon]
MNHESTRLIEDIKNITIQRPDIQTIILFGSVARGQEREHSDVDFCIILDNDKIKKVIQQQILAIEKKYNKNINVVFTTSTFEKLDRQFIETLLREGIVLFGKLPEVPIQRLELEPYEIIKYDLSAMNQSEKMKIKRLLYGIATTKKYKEKIYENKQKGKVEEFGGMRIGIASILIPEKMSWQIEEILRNHNVALRKITIWLSKP